MFSSFARFSVLFCATQFDSISSFLMARDVPVSPVLASSANMVSPNGSLTNFEGIGYREKDGENQPNLITVTALHIKRGFD